MSRLAGRVKKLEGGGDIEIVMPHRVLTTEAEREAYSEQHRRKHGLPPGARVILLNTQHDF